MVRLGILALLLAAVVVYCWATMIKMPGQSYAGAIEPWTQEDEETAASLRAVVEQLAGTIGPRNLDRLDAYRSAQKFIEESFESVGYAVRRQEYEVEKVPVYNLEVEVRGTTRAEEILVIGAHYDTVAGSPGANDNSSGVAATLALAELLREATPQRTIRFVAFANEEAPRFLTRDMGSWQYAREAREKREQIVGMISLETIGFYSNEPGSQQYPFPLNLLYPSEGNFIGFVSNTGSRGFLRQVVGEFRKHARIPSEGASLPERVPGVGWSDHWSFWQFDYPAMMVTDTAPYRYPHYHTGRDTPDKVDYRRMARVVLGMQKVIETLANPDQRPGADK